MLKSFMMRRWLALCLVSTITHLPYLPAAHAQEISTPDSDTDLDEADIEWEVVDDADDDDGEEDLPDEFDDDDDDDGILDSAEDEDTDGILDDEDLDSYRTPEKMPVIRIKQDDQDDAQDTLPPGGDTPYSIGGNVVGDRQVPWQAQIYGPFTDDSFDSDATRGMELWQKQHVCGGSLISAEWVLTAAHCINQKMVNQFYRVRLGAEDISREAGVTYRIDRIVRHAGFDNMYRNDIALVHIVPDNRTRQPADPGQVSAVSLSPQRPPDQGDVFSAGWGRVVASNKTVRRGNDLAFAADGNFPNSVLMKVDLKVIAADACQSLPGYEPVKLSGSNQAQPRVHAGVICAGKPGKATCRGDSGGPLFRYVGNQAVLVGIVSWGKGRCTGDGQPGVYTSVAHHYSWIRRALQVTDPLTSELN